MFPRSVSDLTAAQDIVLCNLAAGWGTTTLQMQQFGGGVGSVSSRISVDDIDPSARLGNTVPNTPEDANNQIYWYYTQFPQRQANITHEWAQYLNPLVRNANRSVFDLIKKSILLQPHRPQIRPKTAQIRPLYG